MSDSEEKMQVDSGTGKGNESKEEPMEEETEETRQQEDEQDEEMEDEQNGDSHDAKFEADSFKRFEMLLKKTENFSHCLSAGDVAAYKAGGGPPKKKRGRQSKAAGNDGDHRHRKTEQEEDEEQLEAAEKEDTLVLFDKNPFYILNGEMRDYQIRGLNWLISLQHNNINGILADEMGLGKTLQTIALLGYMKHYKNMASPHLVIVPKSTLKNWMNEFEKWCPSMKICSIIGDEQTRNVVIRETILPQKFDVCVTTYEMMLKIKTQLRKLVWKYIIIDEAHRIKNEKSKLSEVVREIKSKNRLLITGTPLQNNLHELWALLNFLLPDMFSSSEDFDSWFTDGSMSGNAEIIQRLHKARHFFNFRNIF
ncbi:hypothetical protein WR25_02934 [Diploscapter pachys]|uniref:Helicase ATP-binding domain-containing protein n=1 Tax=Diploscapter pachys TaxID=2018661 RepID=A0A2A2L2Z8_9BILA|nr:hypothetical protein WR25_02934 [Diploscapter pachys]